MTELDGAAAFGPAVDADDDLLDELFLADTPGPVRLLRAAVPRLVEARRPGRGPSPPS